MDYISDQELQGNIWQKCMVICLQNSVISVGGMLKTLQLCITYGQRTKLTKYSKNIFIFRQFVRNFATKSVGKKCLETVCRSEQIGGRPCRGKMHDTILDWEHNLPDNDLALADLHSRWVS